MTNSASLAGGMKIEIRKQLLDDLTSAGRLKERRWIEDSSYCHSARWLRWRGGYRKRMLWTNEMLKTALRMRLIQPIPANRIAAPALVCACGARFEEDAWHCLDCPNNQGHRNQRHTQVRNILGSYLESIRIPGDNKVTREVLAPNTGKRADLLLIEPGNRRTYVDVSITNTCSSTALGSESGNDVLEACADRKRAEYVGLQTADGLMVPFVLAATGKMDATALCFVSQFANNFNKTRHHHKTKCLTEISVVVAQYGARLFNDAMRRSSVAAV